MPGDEKSWKKASEVSQTPKFSIEDYSKLLVISED
jgi:hypothetical protein